MDSYSPHHCFSAGSPLICNPLQLQLLLLCRPYFLSLSQPLHLAFAAVSPAALSCRLLLFFVWFAQHIGCWVLCLLLTDLGNAPFSEDGLLFDALDQCFPLVASTAFCLRSASPIDTCVFRGSSLAVIASRRIASLYLRFRRAFNIFFCLVSGIYSCCKLGPFHGCPLSNLIIATSCLSEMAQGCDFVVLCFGPCLVSFVSMATAQYGPTPTSSTVDAQLSSGSLFFGSSDSTTNSFTLHHSDSPTMVFVSPPLSGDNYGTWLRAITITLSAKSKFGFVDGSFAKPTTQPNLGNWERCNDMVISWFLNSITLDIRSSLLYATTANEIWVDLFEHFTQSNAPQLYQLIQSITHLKQDDLSVSAYYTQLKAMWNELHSLITLPPCTCGHGQAVADHLHRTRSMEFLQGLHDRFASLRSQVLLMDPFPSVKRIYSLVHQEEKQQDIHSASSHFSDATALVAKPTNRGGTSQRGHSSNCKTHSHYTHCGRHGHIRDRCYKLIGYPPWKTDASVPPSPFRDQAFVTQPTPRPGDPSPMTPPSLTQEQYTQLLVLISPSSSNASHAHIADPSTRKTIGQGNAQDGLYYLHAASSLQ